MSRLFSPVAAVAVLLLLVAIAYANSLSGPFVFDDAPAIVDNPSIRNLGDFGKIFSPPPDEGQTVGGRPLVNFTLALNYALNGTEPRGYHIFNVIVHALAALALFGVVRRTLLLPRLADRFGDVATPLAWAIAAVWAVHPLLTESVTYIVQRAESLMALFYLLTLYAFVRAMTQANANRGTTGWLLVSFVACLLGMATKEVMVSAPIVVLIFDRTFVATSWKEVRERRGFFHASLMATWLLLAWLVHAAGNRGGTAGLGAGDSSWTYALIQARAIVHYLWLVAWPHPLVFDYGMHVHIGTIAALPFALGVLMLIASVGWGLRHRPLAGFLGIAFFAILAPSSSVVPIAVQPVAEHRMYLPLAALVTLGLCLAYTHWRQRTWWIAGVLIAALVPITIARNADYRSELSLWEKTVARRPQNARAHGQYADALLFEGRTEPALEHYAEAVRLERLEYQVGQRTLLPDLLVNYGNALLAVGRVPEAVAHYEEALRADPDSLLAHYDLGCVLLEQGRLREAETQLKEALRIRPDHASAHNNLASALLQQRRLPEAIAHYEEALKLEPSAKSHFNLGNALRQSGRTAEARVHFEAALKLEPGFAPAQQELAEMR